MVNPEHRTAIVRELEAATYPSGNLDKDDAWLGIIQVLSWYEWNFLHIFDSSELNPERVGEEGKPRFDGPWQRRAKAAEAQIAERLGVSVGEVRGLIGRLWRHDFWRRCKTPQQKANPVGNGFRYIGAHLLQLFGDSRFSYREEQPMSLHWPGIAIPGVAHPAADVMAVAHVGSVPKAIVSCKWSMRTDRVSEAVRECGAVTTAAHRVHQSIRFYILCHEYGASRIEKLLEDDCVTGLALVNLPLMEPLGLLTAGLQDQQAKHRLMDLPGLIDATFNW